MRAPARWLLIFMQRSEKEFLLEQARVVQHLIAIIHWKPAEVVAHAWCRFFAAKYREGMEEEVIEAEMIQLLTPQLPDDSE